MNRLIPLIMAILLLCNVPLAAMQPSSLDAVQQVERLEGQVKNQNFWLAGLSFVTAGLTALTFWLLLRKPKNTFDAVMNDCLLLHPDAKKLSSDERQSFITVMKMALTQSMEEAAANSKNNNNADADADQFAKDFFKNLKRGAAGSRHGRSAH